MIKKIFLRAVSLLLVFAPCGLAMDNHDASIGKEYIQPLNYPKLSLSWQYVPYRMIDTYYKTGKIPPTNLLGLSFETGLYKYLNAGGKYLLILSPQEGGPASLRLSIFVKPIFPLSERVGLFAKLGGGIGALLASPRLASSHALAAVGIEFFPFSRMGIAFEYSASGEIIFGKENYGKLGTVYEFPLGLTLHLIL